LSTSPAEINIVTGWDYDMPGQKELHKVPSVITYDDEFLVSSWGYKLDKSNHSLSWFKMLLSDQAKEHLQNEQPQRYKRLETLLEIKEKTPVEVVADYLRCLWTHAMNEIMKEIGKNLWDNIKIKIALTVPAIWDHKAQELTKRAAEMAGMLERADTTLELIGEPEAAALSVFNEMRVQKMRGLQVSASP
jgi:molecular chaperone DnaK (HSP70)